MKTSIAILFLSVTVALGQGIGPISGGGGTVKSFSFNNTSGPFTGTVLNSTSTPVLSLSIKDDVIAASKLTLQNSSRILGRLPTNSTGTGEELRISQVLDWIAPDDGAMLFRLGGAWQQLSKPLGQSVLSHDTTAPAWEATSDFQLKSEKSQPNGYPPLDGAGHVPDTFLTGLEHTDNKGGISGYAPLDASQHVPNTNLGTGAAGAGAKALFDDHTFKSVAGGGSIVDVAIATANGISGTSDSDPTTPTITIVLGAITPTTIVASGAISGPNLSGSNTGDQTVTLTGDVIGTGTGTFAATIDTNKVTYAKMQQAANAYRLLGNPTNAAGNYTEVPVQAAQFDSGALKLYAPSQPLSGTTPTADAAVSKVFYITLTGNTTIGLSNFGDGDVIAFRVKQAAAGGPYTVTITGVTNWQGGSQPVQTTTANKADWYMLQKTAAGIDAMAQQNF